MESRMSSVCETLSFFASIGRTILEPACSAKNISWYILQSCSRSSKPVSRYNDCRVYLSLNVRYLINDESLGSRVKSTPEQSTRNAIEETLLSLELLSSVDMNAVQEFHCPAAGIWSLVLGFCLVEKAQLIQVIVEEQISIAHRICSSIFPQQILDHIRFTRLVKGQCRM